MKPQDTSIFRAEVKEEALKGNQEGVDTGGGSGEWGHRNQGRGKFLRGWSTSSVKCHKK